jgi:ATP-dependent helicase IRC3
VSSIHLPNLKLRDYQVEAAEAVMDFWRDGGRRALVQLPTGAGKTVLGLALARACGRTLWIAHRDELIEQPRLRAIDAMPEIDLGVVAADVNEPTARDLVVGSVQTLARRKGDAFPRLDAILAGGLDLVVVDEAHHFTGGDKAFDRPVLRALERTGAKLLGLTATVERADGEALDGLFERIVYSMQLREAISSGLLAPFAGVRRVKVAALEYTASEIEAVGSGSVVRADRELAERVEQDLDAIVNATVEAWQKYARRADGTPRKGVVFTVLVEQAERTAAALNSAGVRAGVVSGETPRQERRRTLAALASGDLDVVVNAAVLTEGFDCPPVDCVLLARPCSSKTLYLQAIGRASRLSPGKADWLVIDLGGGSDLHALEQAPLLVGVEKRQGVPREQGQGPRREGPSFVAMAEPPEPVRWVDVFGDGLTWASGAGQGRTVLVRLMGGRWLVDVMAAGARIENVGKYRALDLAHGVGADAVKRLGGLGLAAMTRQGWRSRPATDAQRAAASKWGIVVPFTATRGEVSDLITRKVVSKKLRRPSRLEVAS